MVSSVGQALVVLPPKAETQRIQQDEPKKKAVTHGSVGHHDPGPDSVVWQREHGSHQADYPISLFLRYHCGHERYYSAMR
jgi:hypothetical protein